MAIFHLSVKSVQRSKGRSSTAAAAYRSASRIADERSQKVHDYTRKQGVAFTAVIVPEGETAPDRATLWNAAEAAERRKDGVPAKEVEIALPDELDAAQRQELAETFSRSLAERYGCAVDLCIHEPSKEGDQRNHHAHVMFTTRVFRGGQLAEKIDLELAERDRKKKGLVTRRQEVTELRHHFAELVNKALERAGRPERVDARSFKDQGRAEDDEPTIHKGPAVTAMERRGVMTDRAEENRLTYEIRAEVAKMEAAQKDVELAKAQKAEELEAAANQRAAEEKAAFKRFTEKLEENRPYLGKTERDQELAFQSYQRHWQRATQRQRPAIEEKVFTIIGEAKEQALQLQKEQEQKAALARTAEEREAFKRRLNKECRGMDFGTVGKRMAFEKKCMEAWDSAPDTDSRKQLEEETFKALQKAREQDRGR